MSLRGIVPAALGLLAAPAAGQISVVDGPHNLSVTGPGPLRALSETRVCVFCHTPHNASPQAPLWNRYDPPRHYRIYASRTMQARRDQPGPESKMCLSCHDGTVAPGLLRSRGPHDPVPMTHAVLPSGPADLTTDLSDDHPVGLRYDRALTRRDAQLRPPEQLDRRIRLGPRGELECTACHDAHDNRHGDFLRLPLRESALCTTCHALRGWRSGAHGTSVAGVPPAVTGGQALPFASLRDNGCQSCHVAHHAAHRPQLLRADPDALCLGCHDGLTARSVGDALGLRSAHRPDRFRAARHDPGEDPLRMRPHVACTDCHDPHALRSDPAGSTPGRAWAGLPAALYGAPGVSLSGVPVPQARHEYEVCFRCHADNPVPLRRRVLRQRDADGNLRRQLLPTAASAHPVTFPARSLSDVPSLRPEARLRRQLRCQDCHDNPDARGRGGAASNGPHGSRFDFLLADRYETADLTAESPQAYALCYRCHDRASILNDESFPLHRVHIVRGRSPCSACHAAHGVTGSPARHSHLINFDLTIVRGERLFVDRGRWAGSCTLTCHGVRHVNFSYGPGGPP